MKKSRLLLALAAVLATSPTWASQYRVQNWVGAWYENYTGVTSALLGSNPDGSPKTFGNWETLGSVYGNNTGNTAASAPPALSYTGTWTGDAARGLNDVDYSVYASTTWGSNHAAISLDNYKQVDTSSTSNYVLSDAAGNPISGAPVIPVNTQTSSSASGYAQSQWEELYMIGGSSISALGHYNATFHVDGSIGPSTNANGTGSASMNWSLSDFNGQQLVSIQASYDVASNTWWKDTYSAGAWNSTSGSGTLTINEDLHENGGTFTYGTALSLNALLSTSVSGNGVNSFENTVKMTELELPGGSSVYAESGTPLSNYHVAFNGNGGGVLCNDLNCAVNGTGGGTVVPGVPEPETWALMLAGLALVWGARRRST